MGVSTASGVVLYRSKWTCVEHDVLSPLGYRHIGYFSP